MTLWFVLAGAVAIGVGFLVYRRNMAAAPGAVNPSSATAYGGKPAQYPPPPPTSGNPAMAKGGYGTMVEDGNAAITGAVCSKLGVPASACASYINSPAKYANPVYDAAAAGGWIADNLNPF